MSGSLSVAPHAGAWIEIMPAQAKESPHRVAPRVGAWIEMRVRRNLRNCGGGRAPRGRVD